MVLASNVVGWWADEINVSTDVPAWVTFMVLAALALVCLRAYLR